QGVSDLHSSIVLSLARSFVTRNRRQQFDLAKEQSKLLESVPPFMVLQGLAMESAAGAEPKKSSAAISALEAARRLADSCRFSGDNLPHFHRLFFGSDKKCQSWREEFHIEQRYSAAAERVQA
ncbi:MAG: hypothetical protein ACK559_28175, partial [bacterium]